MKKILTLLGLLVVLCTTKAYAESEIDNRRLFSTSENSRIEIATYNLMADCVGRFNSIVQHDFQRQKYSLIMYKQTFLGVS